ncbi:MAG: class I SAM-dependent methyltransferase [Ignavibacteriae bacterium]|nr:class I SAM-dependent methyltransferase [Ignavibacteriota bacterium]
MNEIQSSPFDEIAREYDKEFEEHWVTQHIRSVIWKELLKRFKPSEHILELNCGTGTDALYLARNGIRVTGLDASSKMLEVAQRKADNSIVSHALTFLNINNEDLNTLNGKQFDGALSNFGGLNCNKELLSVISNVATLIKPEKYFVACLINRVYPWEIVSFAIRGKFKSAFRRFQKEGIDARLGKTSVHVWYYSVGEFIRILPPYFSVENIFGINVFSPNPNSRAFIFKHESLTKFLLTLDDKITHRSPFYLLGDHVLVVAKRK